MLRPEWPAALLLAAVLFSPVITQAATDAEIRAVSEQLVCYCGCSGLTVAACSCGTADQIRARISGQLDEGQSTDQVVQIWVNERGEQVLANPTREGFNIVGWVMPFVVLILALATLTLILIRRRDPLPAGSGGSMLPELDQATLDRIDKGVRTMHRDSSDHVD